MSEHEPHEMELQKHIQRLQHQLEELRDKYETSQQNVTVMELEKKEINEELVRIKQENEVLTEKNIELQSIKNTMQIEREHLFNPRMEDLESSELQKTQLESELSLKSEHISQLNNENIQIKEENEKYKQTLEQHNTNVRKKQKISNSLIKTLEDQIETLKHENDELNKRLFKCELDLYAIRKQTFEKSDDEKVTNQIQPSLLNHMESNIEIEINDIDDEEIQEPEPETDSRDTSRISGRKTSIVLSFNDLASVLTRTDSGYGYSLKSKLMQYNNNKPNGPSTSFASLNYNVNEEDQQEEENDNNNQEEDSLTKFYDSLDKDREIIELKEKNNALKLDVEKNLEQHKKFESKMLEQQKELESKLDKKDKKINNLKQRNESLQLTLSKRGCNLVPFCK